MTIHEAAKQAMIVQDACNLSGVVHSFARILAGPLSGLGTDARNRHPICVLFSSKIASLTGAGLDDVGAFGNAWRECERLAAEVA